MIDPRPRPLSGDAFLVRIWWEARDRPDDLLVWRGRVEHVASSRAVYFDDFTELLAFIENRIGSLSLPTAMAGKQEEEE